MEELPWHVRQRTASSGGSGAQGPGAPVDALAPLVRPSLRERATQATTHAVQAELEPHSIVGRVSTGISMLPGPTHGWDLEHTRHQSVVARDEAQSAWSALKQGNVRGAATMGLKSMTSTVRATTGLGPAAAALHGAVEPISQGAARFASELVDRGAQAAHRAVPDPVGPIRRPGPKLKKE